MKPRLPRRVGTRKLGCHEPLERAAVFALLAVAVAGCPAATVGTTAGNTPDAGSPPDAGKLPDGGTPDAGVLPDGGAVPGLAITTFGIDGSRDSLFIDSAFTKANLAAIQAAGA